MDEEEFLRESKRLTKRLKHAMSPLNALKKGYVDNVLSVLDEMKEKEIISSEYCENQKRWFLNELNSPSKFKDSMSEKIRTSKEKIKALIMRRGRK